MNVTVKWNDSLKEFYFIKCKCRIDFIATLKMQVVDKAKRNPRFMTPLIHCSLRRQEVMKDCCYKLPVHILIFWPLST